MLSISMDEPSGKRMRFHPTSARSSASLATGRGSGASKLQRIRVMDHMKTYLFVREPQVGELFDLQEGAQPDGRRPSANFIGEQLSFGIDHKMRSVPSRVPETMIASEKSATLSPSISPSK